MQERSVNEAVHALSLVAGFAAQGNSPRRSMSSQDFGKRGLAAAACLLLSFPDRGLGIVGDAQWQEGRMGFVVRMVRCGSALRNMQRRQQSEGELVVDRIPLPSSHSQVEDMARGR